MKILAATNNYDKVKEIKNILKCDITTLKELDIVSDPEENANSYKENALIKAREAFRLAPKGYAVLADDSGLSVEVLDGAPGLFSARYAGVNGEHPTYKDNCEKLLAAMKGQTNRKAYFESDIILILPDETIIHTVGICRGIIAEEQKGEEGFGYDPLFMPDVYDNKLTMAELGTDEKNKISHRAIALQKLKLKLQECDTIC